MRLVSAETHILSEHVDGCERILVEKGRRKIEKAHLISNSLIGSN